jgi:hypothetical protein
VHAPQQHDATIKLRVGVPLLATCRRNVVQPLLWQAVRVGGWTSVNFYSFTPTKHPRALVVKVCWCCKIANTNSCALPAFKASRQLELNTRATRRPCTDSIHRQWLALTTTPSFKFKLLKLTFSPRRLSCSVDHRGPASGNGRVEQYQNTAEYFI